jgi:hypothetical protein
MIVLAQRVLPELHPIIQNGSNLQTERSQHELQLRHLLHSRGEEARKTNKLTGFSPHDKHPSDINKRSSASTKESFDIHTDEFHLMLT